jgi:hypothetical protein
MPKGKRFALKGAIITFCLGLSISSFSQRTLIRGFVDVLAGYENDKLSFGLGEQDLFITSELNDRLNFLGETVFRLAPGSPTQFSVSVERVIIKYNITGNHNFLFGKHHTPINYWNDTYHHGRVFFPTIDRPLLFVSQMIPLHTTGISLQGHDLGSIKFGYDLMLGNGLGSGEVKDNDNYKSITAAMHIKPADRLRIGMSYYNDVISPGSNLHGHIIEWKVKQHLLTGSVAYFGNKFELLTEATFGINSTDTTGSQNSVGAYLYNGYKLTEKFIPYIRVDKLHYQAGEVYYNKNNSTSFIGGIRFQINYLAVVKLEYQYLETEVEGSMNRFTAQFAIGF